MGDFEEIRSRLERLQRENIELRCLLIAMLVMAAVGVILALVPSVKAQTASESMNFGGQEFTVGMQKEEALRKLGICCRISGRDNSYFIEQKDEPMNMLGAIWFSGGKVRSIQRDVDQFSQEEAVNLGQTIFRLLSRLSKSELERITVETSTREASNGTMREVLLTFPNGRSAGLRINKIDANSSNLRDSVDVYENLAQ